jgi:hypothetical protein
MIKTIHCDQHWEENSVKTLIKKTLETYLNILREQRVFSLGENTVFEELPENDLKISAGTTLEGVIKIKKGPSEEILVNFNYDENRSLNKRLWEGFIQTIEEQLKKS